MKRTYLSALAPLGLLFGIAQAQVPPELDTKPFTAGPLRQEGEPPLRIVGRPRPNFPVRLGGVFTLGLGESRFLLEESARNQTRLSADNARWIAENCDTVAFNAVNLTPDTYPKMRQVNEFLTPLLLFSASSLYEQPYYRGNVGGWRPQMAAWTLRDRAGKEIPHPEPGGHWMDFANTDWAMYWRDSVWNWARQYLASGAVVSELPLANTFVGDNLARYHTFADRVEATNVWLTAARAPGRFLTIPSSLGFEELLGRPTLPPPTGAQEPQLPGRLWDHYYAQMDGALAEGWLRPYWSREFVSESTWELQLEAADRAARNGQVFIAAAAFRNDAELEFLLASYLLVYRKQGSFVFQPMPQIIATRPDAGHSLALYRETVRQKAAWFHAPLGVAKQERHLIQAELDPNEPPSNQARQIWRRVFQNGVVYVNPDEKRLATLFLTTPMKRVTGEKVERVELPPRSGAILLY